MEELVPPHFITPKIMPFTGIEDPDGHLKAFRAQMIIYGGSGTVRCKMFVWTLMGTTLQRFNGILDVRITSFQEFSNMFKEQFSANKIEPPRLADLFDVRQGEGESYKEYLNRFYVVSVRLRNLNEEIGGGCIHEGPSSKFVQ